MWKRKEAGEHMAEHRKNGVVYFTFPSLDRYGWLLNGFSSRLGGVSQGDLSELNLSFARGDERPRVEENFRRISSAIGFAAENMVFTDQTHTAIVREAGMEDCGKGFLRPKDYQDVDGLVTNCPGLVLTAFFADCVPVYFVDPLRRAIGLVHSGWRGTVQNIAAETVRMMHECYGTDPANLAAAIGPSICRDCYEVGEDVAKQFREQYPRRLWPMLLREQETHPEAEQAGEKEQKYRLDLWEACRQNLLGAGLRPEHIAVTDLCTCCNPSLFFSHRASGGRRGNLAGFLSIKAERDGTQMAP